MQGRLLQFTLGLLVACTGCGGDSTKPATSKSSTPSPTPSVAKTPNPTPEPDATKSKAGDASGSVPAKKPDPKPTAVAVRGVLWEIGKPEKEPNGFNTSPEKDPDTIDFKIGDPASKFPEQLGTDIGKQRSTVRIHFTGPIPANTTLNVRWHPGGSDDVDQFRVELDGKPLSESPALKGSNPTKWRTETFPVPVSDAKEHVLVFTHPQGDGLTWAHVYMEAK